jgi:rhomboid protease GluP
LNELEPGYREDEYSEMPLPPVRQPKGLSYFFGTWSGRILLINLAVFVYLCVRTGSLFLPDTDTLLQIGAKDPVQLAQGQFWRLITPIFIHIGIIHFAFNSYFLYVVGYQIEKVLGGAWFVGIYLASGLAGNIASSVFSVNLSAGASSSLFGLLGAGLFLERTIGRRIMEVTGRRPRNRAYLVTVLINLAFGALVPFIDNSAHVGGLLAGTALTFAMVNLKANNLQPRHQRTGWAAVGGLTLLCVIGGYFGSAPRYVEARLIRAGDTAGDSEERIFQYTRAIAVDPSSIDAHLKRARELFAGGEANLAMHDVRAILAHGGEDLLVEQLADEQAAKGRMAEAWQIRRLVAHDAQQP